MHYSLHKHSKDTGITVRPDRVYPGMWRIHWADGSVSGMCNIARAKNEAAQAVSVGARAFWLPVHADTLSVAVEAPPAAGAGSLGVDSQEASGGPVARSNASRSVSRRRWWERR